MIEDLIDMHQAAKLVGCTTTTAEKYLAAVGVVPVAQIATRGGHMRYYQRGRVTTAQPSYADWHAANLHRRAKIAAEARHGGVKRHKRRDRTMAEAVNRKVIADPASIKKLERLAEALADVLNDLAAK